MTWARVDDRANEHPKLLRAGPEAAWLWTCGLMYANRQAARDGFVPAEVVPMLYPLKPATLKRCIATLVRERLWTPTEGGFAIHDFKVWNKTREQIEEEREEGRRRAAESYARRKAAREGRQVFADSSAEDSEAFARSSGSSATTTPDPDPPPPPIQDLPGTQRPPRPEQTSGGGGTGPGRPRVPPSLADALEIPPQPRAQAVIGSGDTAAGDWSRAAEWPEVRAIADAVTPGAKLGAYSRDAGVRAVVGLLADGWTVEAVVAVAPALVASPWWRQARRGLSALTPEVLRRAAAAPPDAARGGKRDPLADQLENDRAAGRGASTWLRPDAPHPGPTPAGPPEEIPWT
jgi:hypothetical protein